MAFVMSEVLLAMFAPIAVYWIAAAIYELTLSPMEKYRLFTKEEEDTQNLATRRQVIVGVLINQAAQVGLTALMFLGTGDMLSAADTSRSPGLLKVAGQLAVAMLVMDCWEYFWHRATHEVKFLYKHVHSMHHHLIVPYSYGSQYIHPADSFVGEGIGGLLSTYVSGMSPLATTLFSSVLTIKGLDDHCGMWFPNHPIHRWLANNSAFHAVHHQHQGFKHNYSVHFLATWDLLLGTYLPFTIEERKHGGFQIKTDKDQ